MADSTASLSVGQEFSSFEDLNSAIKLWEEESVTLYTRSSRTVACSHKRAPRRHMKDELKYAEIDYACVHGGRQYISHSVGKRKHQRYLINYRFNKFLIFNSTFLKDCPFQIKVRLSTDGNKLVIQNIIGEHNHSLSKVRYY